MIPSEYEEFCLTLNASMCAAGRSRPDKATADVFWMKLSGYELNAVKWALVESTDKVENGFNYNVALIKKTLDDELRVNKFREDAMARLASQEKSGKDLAVYLASDDYKKSQSGKNECFSKIQEALNNEL